MASTSKNGIKINNILPVRSIMRTNATETNSFELINKSGILNQSGLSLIDSSNEPLKLTLEDAQLGTIKEISLYKSESSGYGSNGYGSNGYGSSGRESSGRESSGRESNNDGNPVFIHTSKGGYRLDSNDKFKRLIFTECGWKSLSNTDFNFPVSERCKLSSKNVVGKSSAQGSSLAISGDNKTLVVGASGDNVIKGAIGCAFVYVYNGTWVEQTKLVSNDTLNFMSAQGYSVAISDDGDWIAVGAPTDGFLIGSVWIWKRQYSTVTDKYSNRAYWTVYQKIKTTNNIGAGFFGCSVAFNSDASLLFIGADKDNNSGAVYVYTKGDLKNSSSSLSEGILKYDEQQKITVVNQKNLATHLCCNKKGDTIYFTSNNNIWVYTNISSVFEYKFHITNENTGFPSCLSVNTMGDVISSGCCLDEEFKGSCYIYDIKSNGEYTESKISITDNIGKSKFGSSCSLNSKGDLIAIGAPEDNDNTGATWIFVNVNGKWLPYNKYVCSETQRNLSGYIASGSNVCVNEIGNTLFVSNLTDGGNGSVTVWN